MVHEAKLSTSMRIGMLFIEFELEAPRRGHRSDFTAKIPADLSQQHIEIYWLLPMGNFTVIFVSKLKPEFNPGFSS